MPTDRPIVTLTTDFQTTDFYVAAMKAVLLSANRDASIVDVTHAIPRHDITAGSIVLERAVASFPPGTLHLAVIDPGVGTHRGVLVAEIAQQWIVCPDNGLISWTIRRHPIQHLYELTWRPAASSHTFHGRDVMAPAIAMLIAGKPIRDIAKPLTNPVMLDLNLATDRRRGQIIHIDTYGNATTNLPEAIVAGYRDSDVQVRGQNIGPVHNTYGDVQPGEALALIGSSGLLEIAVREGNAAAEMNLKVGDAVALR